MWTQDNRASYERKGQRYVSDLTDAEWALVEPHLPAPKIPRRTPIPVDRREVLNSILYLLTTGCQWRLIPKDLLPKSTVHDYYVDWLGSGTLTKIHHALYAEARELAGRKAEPTLAIVDSQSIKGAEKGGPKSIPRVMMRARKSKASSGTPWSIPRG